MRTSFDLSRSARSLLAPLAVIAALVASPHMAAGQKIDQHRYADPVADFQRFLPAVASIPWLEARSATAQKSTSPLPEAGSVAAWLLTPRPAALWASGHTQAAFAGNGIEGM